MPRKLTKHIDNPNTKKIKDMSTPAQPCPWFYFQRNNKEKQTEIKNNQQQYKIKNLVNI